MAVALRPLAPSDSIDALTALLHRAYSPLGAMGLVQARDWAAMQASFAAEATLDWPCTGERLVGADRRSSIGVRSRRRRTGARSRNSGQAIS